MTALRTAITSKGFCCLDRLFVIQSGPAAVFCKSFISPATSDTWTGAIREERGSSLGDMCVRLSYFFSDSKMLRQYRTTLIVQTARHRMHATDQTEPDVRLSSYPPSTYAAYMRTPF